MSTPAVFQQRLPFAGLLIAAIAGILASSLSPTTPAWAWFCLSLGSLAAWLGLRRTPAVLAAVAAAFATAHVLQTTSSMASHLAGVVGLEHVIASVTGRVVDAPEPRGNGKVAYVLQTSGIATRAWRAEWSLPIMVVSPAPGPGRGDSIEITGSLSRVPPARNPEQFDMSSWLSLKGIRCQLEAASPSDTVVTRRAAAWDPLVIADRCRAWMERTLSIGIANSGYVPDLLAGMVLGITRDIPDDVQTDFRNTGTYHLFSVSGLHVGMIGVILWQVLRIAGAGRRVSVAIIIPSLFFYTLVTGWKPPGVRSAMMAAIFMIGMVSSRRPVPVNALCAAGFFLLAACTNDLFNPGFQLSFLVVLSILLLSGPIQTTIELMVRPDPFLPRRIWTRTERFLWTGGQTFAGLAAVSLAAWAGSLPLIVHYFHIISFSALLANLLIVPLAFVIMATAVVALGCGLVSQTLAAIFNNANWALVHILVAIVQSLAAAPGSHVLVGSPPTTGVHMTVFDLGAGGATALETGDRILLYDCGSEHDERVVIEPWLRSRGRSAPDILIVSHGDARHLGGAEALLRAGSTPVLIDSAVGDRSASRRKLHQLAADTGIPKSIVQANDRIACGKAASIRILHPPAGIEAPDADDKTVVTLINAGTVRILLASDAGPAVWHWLLENDRKSLRADILVLGKHGSGIPADMTFLDAVEPSLIVATAAEFPSKEALAEDWEEQVRARGIRLFRQDETGAVEIHADGGTYSAKAWLDGRTFSAAAGFTPARCEQSHR